MFQGQCGPYWLYHFLGLQTAQNYGSYLQKFFKTPKQVLVTYLEPSVEVLADVAHRWPTRADSGHEFVREHEGLAEGGVDVEFDAVEDGPAAQIQQ